MHYIYIYIFYFIFALNFSQISHMGKKGFNFTYIRCSLHQNNLINQDANQEHPSFSDDGYIYVKDFAITLKRYSISEWIIEYIY